MKNSILAASITVLVLSGCTGTEVRISPEPTTIQVSNNVYNSIGLRDVPSEKSIPIFGHMTEAFGNEIRTSGYAKDVYYPLRPNDKVEISLDSQFNSEVDTHSGSAFAKAFMTGFTLFLLEPLFWYDFDYKLSGNVNVLRDGKIIKQVKANTDATISAKWLSLSDISKQEGSVIAQAKKSLFLQLLKSIGK